jgi:hypothetical protein
MDETNPGTAATRVAVECLTLWLEPASERLNAAKHIAELAHDPDGPGADRIITGLLNLSMWLVLDLAKERGATAEDMRERAMEYLRDFSRQLPE